MRALRRVGRVVGRRLLGCLKARDGAVAVIAAIVIALTGVFFTMITDMTRTQVALGRLQGAADAAALASARELALGEGDMAALARTVFDAALDGGVGGMRVTRFSVAVEPPAQGVTDTVRVRAAAEIDSPALRLVGLVDGRDWRTLSVEAAATRSVLGVEVVMALDNTGSMAGARINELRSAADTLARTLFGPDRTSPNLRMGIVNYAATVNIGRQNAGWLDRPLAVADAAAAPGVWKGCVRVRSAALGETDAPPAPGAMFAPQFWSSSIIGWNPPRYDGYYLWNYWFQNIWPPAEYYRKAEAAGAWRPRCFGARCPRAQTCQYKLRDNAGTRLAEGPSIHGWCPPDPMAMSPYIDERRVSGNGGYGPNLGCPAPSTPLTASRDVVLDAIGLNAGDNGDRVDAWSRGGTFGNFGLAWAWRMISPRWKGLWRDRNGEIAPDLPRDYGDPYRLKIIVLMTDGANGHYLTDVTAYGRPDEIIARNQIDPSMLRLCEAIKRSGVVLYAITFGNVHDATRRTYGSCASDPDSDQRIAGPKYFNAPSGEALQEAFGAIAGQLQGLRLAP